MLIFPTYQTLLAKPVVATGGDDSDSGIVSTDLFVHYDFSNTDSWNQTTGTDTEDYTVYNLAHNHNNALIRSRTGSGLTYQNDSSSTAISYESSDGGGCIEIDPSVLTGWPTFITQRMVIYIPGSQSISYWGSPPTVSETSSDNLFYGIGTGPFTFETWVRYYIDDSYTGGYDHRLIYEMKTKRDDETTGFAAKCNYYLRLTGAGYSNSASHRRKIRTQFQNPYPSILYSSSDAIPSTGSGWSDWLHLVYSRNSNSTSDTKLYANNSLILTRTDNADFSHFLYGTLFDTWKPQNSLSRFGIFRFYRGKALTSSEVTTNWNAQKSRFGH